MFPRFSLPLLAGLVMLWATGCSTPEGPATYQVSGEVSFQGQPIDEGQIIFEPLPADGTRPAGGTITEGKFLFEIEPGSKRVKIVAEREVGQVDPVMGARARENYIPAKYNEQSQLEAEVTSDAEQNVYRYELEK